MILSIIAALDEEGGIGFNNQIPWHLPGDLGRFKKLTMGHHLILGLKTYQSIGKPLPGRMMIVLSRNPEYKLTGGLVADSLQDALRIAQDAGESEAFVIGGAEIYQLALPIADRMYLSHVHTTSQADVFFPEYDHENWLRICEQEFPADQANPIGYTFMHLIRKISP
jgi:dihydrofolate reductase